MTGPSVILEISFRRPIKERLVAKKGQLVTVAEQVIETCWRPALHLPLLPPLPWKCCHLLPDAAHDKSVLFLGPSSKNPTCPVYLPRVHRLEKPQMQLAFQSSDHQMRA